MDGDVAALAACTNETNIESPMDLGPLHYAAVRGRLVRRRWRQGWVRSYVSPHTMTYQQECVRWLLEHGANVDAASASGLTPLAAVLAYPCHAYSQSHACLDLLVDYGADVRLKRSDKGNYAELSAYVAKRAMHNRTRACRNACTAVIGCRRFGRSPVLQSNNRDAIVLIAKALYDMRADNVRYSLCWRSVAHTHAVSLSLSHSLRHGPSSASCRHPWRSKAPYSHWSNAPTTSPRPSHVRCNNNTKHNQSHTECLN